jgi:hypothetical protein
MLGCVATAPANKAAIPTTFPDNFGGNMDYNGMGVGATVMLPVFEPGALFFLGDGHARQGDGEVLGSAIETSLDVEFSVDLIKGKKINWPRLENQDFIMVLGSSRAINEALQHATTELMRWLMESYGFDERGASLLLGQGIEYEIANVVDPEFTIVAKMSKRYLGQPHQARRSQQPVPNYIRTYFLNRFGTDLGVEFDATESGFWGNASKPYSSLRIRSIAVMSLYALSLNALVPDRRHLIGDGGPSPTPSPRGHLRGRALMEWKGRLRCVPDALATAAVRRSGCNFVGTLACIGTGKSLN